MNIFNYLNAKQAPNCLVPVIIILKKSITLLEPLPEFQLTRLMHTSQNSL